jgi:tRNA pseudouridine55 synthase
MRSVTEIDGVMLVDKARGMTSHDVVAMARRALGTKKVGHCGTLDPLATGLLLITIGRGTKIQDLLMSEDKEYVGTIRLGEETDSQDADGQIIESRPVPEFSREQIQQAFDKFRGDFFQTPPMVSAIKKNGVPLYKLARGQARRARTRFVRLRARNQGCSPAGSRFLVVCSKDFTSDLCNDIGGDWCGA